MANIPLRAYIREIEGLVDSGQLEETVAHCRHILQSYPKFVDIYRLLGKVFLEVRQFSNAGDILQRVLSAVPDDFVSHVGMSIIREDEGNLDSAIWHMERAFENQPANNAIQDELRRLFGRRDGVEPPKIRLTRGALARMYAKGNLYDQAVAELHGALSEDPQRPDLQILLAKMNYLSGNRVEAVEASSNLLKKFPYCLLANRVLALILPQTDRANDAKIYQERAHSLDPYLSKAGSDALSSVDVPDSYVMIDTLEWKPGQTIPGLPEQPSWAGTLGIKFEEPEEEELPDWLAEDLEIPAYEGEQVAPFVGSEDATIELTEVDESETLIPEWMQEAGWQPSSGIVDETSQNDGVLKDHEYEAEIEKADIPEWLHEIAPKDDIGSEASLEEVTEDEIPTWLDESPPGATDTIIAWLDEKSEEGNAVENFDETLEWIEEDKEDLAVSIPEDETRDEIEIPEWLKDLETEGELELPFDTSTIEDELPDWLDELEESTEENKTPGMTIEGIRTDPDAEIVEFGKTKDISIDDIDQEESDELDPDDQAAALAWLENLAAKQGASEDELITSPEERLEIPPDWIREEKLDSVEEIVPDRDTEGKLPDWLVGHESDENVSDTSDTIDEEDELHEWLGDKGKGVSEDTGPLQEEDLGQIKDIAMVGVAEVISTVADEEDTHQEFLSQAETPFEIPPELESADESAEWILEIEDAEEPHLEEKIVTIPKLEDIEQIDESAVSEIDEVISPKELSKEVVQVDINKASLSELEKISGIGFVLAQSIVDFREKHGPFNTIDDLKKVSGIGEVSFESFKEHLMVEETTVTPVIAPKEPGTVTVDSEVQDAKNALEVGDLERAVEAYDTLIRRAQNLDQIISHLEIGLSQNPDNIHLWQTLGDAYMRNDQYQQALDAYTKAEKLL